MFIQEDVSMAPLYADIWVMNTPTLSANLSYARRSNHSACLLRKIADAEDTPVCSAYIDLDIDGYHNKRNTRRRHF